MHFHKEKKRPGKISNLVGTHLEHKNKKVLVVINKERLMAAYT